MLAAILLLMLLPRWLWLSGLAPAVLFALYPSAVRGAENPTVPAQTPSVHVIEGLGKGTVDLDGAWQFHTGDDPAWASPSFDDGGWTKLRGDKTWGMQGFPSYAGYAWYRLHFSITPVAGAPKEWALLIPQIDDAYELYLNGTLIGKNGRLPPSPTWYLSQPPQTYGLGPTQSGVLAIRVWKAPLSSNDPSTVGGFEGTPVLGGPEAIAARNEQDVFQWLRSSQVEFGLNLLYALIGLLSLLAWLRDRKQWLLLCMAGYTLTQVAGTILGNILIPWPFSITIGLLQPVLMIQDVSLWYLLLLLLKLDDNKRLMRLTRVWVIVFCLAFGLDGLTTALWGSRWEVPLQVIDAILTVIFTPLETLPILLVVVAVIQRKRLDSARWMVAISAFIAEMIFVLRNATSQFVRFTHWTLRTKLNAPLFVFNGNPITPRVLANVFLLASVVYALYRYSIENRRQQAALEQEFKNARELQQVLIPETLPTVPGFSVTSAYRPAQQVGGDFFQIISLEEGSTLVVLGDVSGKGLRAAMAVSLIVGAVRALADDYPRPAELLTQLNRRLCGRLQGGFATCVIVRIGRNSESVVASAGHPAPFLNESELELPGALPLGISPTSTYVEMPFNLEVGDHFSLYTDGLLEARNNAGEIYSFSRLQTLFATRPDATKATEAAVTFGQDDDITVLTLTRLATGQDSTASHSLPSLAPA
jgi:Stage II sporulation protein E (SpoIIE)